MCEGIFSGEGFWFEYRIIESDNRSNDSFFQTCVNRIGADGNICRIILEPLTGIYKLVTVYHEAGIIATVNFKIF